MISMVFFGFPRFAIYFSLSILDCAFAQVLLFTRTTSQSPRLRETLATVAITRGNSRSVFSLVITGNSGEFPVHKFARSIQTIRGLVAALNTDRVKHVKDIIHLRVRLFLAFLIHDRMPLMHHQKTVSVLYSEPEIMCDHNGR